MVGNKLEHEKLEVLGDLWLQNIINSFSSIQKISNFHFIDSKYMI